jgi:hypothetical protein
MSVSPVFLCVYQMLNEGTWCDVVFNLLDKLFSVVLCIVVATFTISVAAYFWLPPPAVYDDTAVVSEEEEQQQKKSRLTSKRF